MSTLRNHVEMIDLNPLVIDRQRCEAPSHAPTEERDTNWYSITDRIDILPGRFGKSKVTYFGCFHDLAQGLQTHVYAPMGLEIISKWTLGGNMPGEPAVPVEIGLGLPGQGLYLREDVDMKCNVVMTSFVKKTLRKAHGTLVQRLVDKAKGQEQQNLDRAATQTSAIGSDNQITTAPSPFINSASYPAHHHSIPAQGDRHGQEHSSYQHGTSIASSCSANRSGFPEGPSLPPLSYATSHACATPPYSHHSDVSRSFVASSRPASSISRGSQAPMSFSQPNLHSSCSDPLVPILQDDRSSKQQPGSLLAEMPG